MATHRLVAGVFVRLSAYLVFLAVAMHFAGPAHSSPVAVEFEGGCATSSSPYLADDSRLESGRISYCDNGDAWTGRIQSTEVPAGTTAIPLLYAGYPSLEGIELTLQGPAGIHPITLPNSQESWTSAVLEVPPEFQPHPFKIVADDNAAGFGGWIGLGVARHTSTKTILLGALALALPLALAHLWCATTSTLVAGRVGMPGWRAACAILVLGGAGAVSFFAWWASPAAGFATSSVLLVAPAACYLAAKVRRRPVARWLDESTAFMPVTFAAAFVLWLGLYPFEWDGASWEVPATRWAGLPVDNWLPLVLAQMLESGSLITPMVGDWLSSDRPPLQAGLYLMFLPAKLAPIGVWYQALATWLQCLILVPMGHMLAAWFSSRRDSVLAIAAVVFSPIFLVNTLFVWPKLLAATFCLIYHIALFSGRNAQMSSRWLNLAAALAAGLAMLSHGGALFALLGTTVAALALQPKTAFRPLLSIAPLSLAVYAPWMLYQRYIDPPGDRLAKWHLAGQIDVDDRSLGETLADSYSELTPRTWLEGRLENVGHIATGTVDFFRALYELMKSFGDPMAHRAAWEQLYAGSFFHFSHSLWFFGPAVAALALIVLLARRRRVPPGFMAAFLATCCGLLVWIAAMFEPGSVSVHQGAYALPMLAMLIVMTLTWHAAPGLFRSLALCSILLALYVFAFDRAHSAVVLHGFYVAGVFTLGTLIFGGFLSSTIHTPRSHPRIN
ncbi:hypothetical protein [Luteimonas huabeiensis]|uniref:hypothetical protein n=1 Tax=Luteimonas huabeiensis TaxID=1244513 RepID=UPI0004B85F4E|nr:hypothetical protein [Luteimonas huabeiensis]